MRSISEIRLRAHRLLETDPSPAAKLRLVRDVLQAHQDLTGATVQKSYLKINNRYSLNILGSKAGLLPAAIETALLNWIWEYDEGIGYLEMPLSKEPPRTKPGPLDRWFASLELMSRMNFQSAQHWSENIYWIWEQQDSDGLWDFGPRSPASTFMPLSDDWRLQDNRKIDWSTRVLLISHTCP